VWRSLMWVIALALTVGVGYVALDVARRAATLTVFTEGYGVPTKSPPEAFRAAERNVIYLAGVAVGVATGVGLSVAAVLWWWLARLRRSDQGTPSQAL
jgi:hypothetical protein